MSNPTITTQEIYEQIESLPQESLADLAEYIEYLRFKLGKATVDEQPPPTRHQVGWPIKGLRLFAGIDCRSAPRNVAEIPGSSRMKRYVTLH